MENTPEAAGAAPAPQTETTPTTNTNDAPAAPDMHGFTSDQLAEMRKFYDANGGFDKVKARISNPEHPSQPAQPNLNATEALEKEKDAMVAPTQSYRPPAGAITPQEFLVQEYFRGLSREEAYAPIAEKISSGAVLKDMAMLGIHPLNEDGSINDMKVRTYLNLAAKTVPAQQPATAPEASSAPTVDYVKVEGDIKDMKQAMAVLQQDSLLQRAGKGGHPDAKKAEEFMRSVLNPNTGKK